MLPQHRMRDTVPSAPPCCDTMQACTHTQQQHMPARFPYCAPRQPVLPTPSTRVSQRGRRLPPSNAMETWQAAAEQTQRTSHQHSKQPHLRHLVQPQQSVRVARHPVAQPRPLLEQPTRPHQLTRPQRSRQVGAITQHLQQHSRHPPNACCAPRHPDTSELHTSCLCCRVALLLTRPLYFC